jgi:hypothetical protein
MGGETMLEPIEPAEMPPASAQPEADEFRPTLSLAGAKPGDFDHPMLGDPSGIWRYCNAAGLLDGYVCRFEVTKSDGTPGKEFRPLRYGTLTINGRARTGWHWRGWGENRPRGMGSCG